MFKYPRTKHIRGSRFQHGDGDMEAVPWEELMGKHLVIEEKMDGANCGISFSETGALQLQSRGHYLRGGPREKQFELLKQWSATHYGSLFELLGTRYVMYGEWLYACHTVWYDKLEHFFMEFDVLDAETNKFLSTLERDTLLRGDHACVRIEPVRVIESGEYTNLDQLTKMITKSSFIDQTMATGELCTSRWGSWHEACRNGCLVSPRGHYGYQQSQYEHEVKTLEKKYDLSGLVEGLYVKWEENGEVKGRYKYVRNDFVSHVAGQEEHWHDRPILPNQLSPGSLVRMFE